MCDDGDGASPVGDAPHTDERATQQSHGAWAARCPACRQPRPRRGPLAAVRLRATQSRAPANAHRPRGKHSAHRRCRGLLPVLPPALLGAAELAGQAPDPGRVSCLSGRPALALAEARLARSQEPDAPARRPGSPRLFPIGPCALVGRLAGPSQQLPISLPALLVPGVPAIRRGPVLLPHPPGAAPPVALPARPQAAPRVRHQLLGDIGVLAPGRVLPGRHVLVGAGHHAAGGASPHIHLPRVRGGQEHEQQRGALGGRHSVESDAVSAVLQLGGVPQLPLPQFGSVRVVHVRMGLPKRNGR